MAGTRRGTGKPLVRTTRYPRRRARFNVELAKAHEPRARVALAADYFRGALALRPDDAAAEQMVTQLVDAADRLYKQFGEQDDRHRR